YFPAICATSLRQAGEEVSLPGTRKKVLATCFHHSECYITGECLVDTQNLHPLLSDGKLVFIMFSISTAGASQDVCDLLLFLQCPKPNAKQMSSSQIIWHSQGTARCAALPSRCSKNILTAVSANKTVR
uniref:Uncharacterized protein n=1 Tax=Taeniopygia guttata TaxID=59729 RepID=A0A674HJD8_TAEGU